MYSDFYFKSKNSISFIIFILAGLSIFSFLIFFFGFNSTTTRASKKIIKRHEIVNLTVNQAAIFWQTEKKEIGWIIYGDNENSVNNLVFDERDVGDKKNPSYYHYVLLKNLERNKVYYYKIISDNEIVAINNNPFSFKTSRNIGNLISIKPAYGKVMQANGLPAENSFVLFNYPNAYTLVTLTKTTGEWLIPLQSVTDKETGEPLMINEEINVKMELLAADLTSSLIEAPVKKTNPFAQTIIIGKDYKLDNAADVLSVSTSFNSTQPSNIDIILPKEGSIITTRKPRLKGTAIAGKEIELSINSIPAFKQRINANNQGEWIIDNPVAMSPGSYTLIMNTLNEKGGKVTLTRNFKIGKSGEQIQGVATESGTLTPTIVPTATLIPTSQVISPTIIETVTSPTPPVTGFDSKIFTYASMALIIIGAGFLIVF